MSNKLEELKKLEIQANTRTVLENLIKQFQCREIWWREGIQNSRGAFAKRIDITFEYDEAAKTLEMCIEDDGEGMNHYDREQFLLKLFSSSKEYNLDRPGKFGIGFISVFAYEPEMVSVESSRQGDHWMLEIDGDDFEARVYEGTPRRGTKVTLAKHVDKRTAETWKKEAEKEVVRSCSRMDCSIFFDGKQINVPLELDAYCQIRFNDSIADGIIGITSEPRLEYYNHYILLQKKDEYLNSDYYVSALINSKHLSFNLSRNDIIRDEMYNKIIKTVYGKLDELVAKAVEEISALQKEEDTKINQRKGTVLWNFLLTYTQKLKDNTDRRSRKKGFVHKLPESVRRARIFPTVTGENVSLEEILAQAKREKLIYTSYKPDLVAKTLKEQGRIVLLRSKEVTDYLSLFGEVQDANYIFYMPMAFQDTDLTDAERRFLDTVRKDLKNSGLAKKYDEIVFGDFSQEYADDRDKPFMLLSDSLGSSSSGKKPLLKAEEQGLYNRMFRNRHTLVLNRYLPYIQEIVKLANTPKAKFASYFLFQLLAVEDSYNSDSDIAMKLYYQFRDKK